MLVFYIKQKETTPSSPGILRERRVRVVKAQQSRGATLCSSFCSVDGNEVINSFDLLVGITLYKNA
jgi:hypothetical protein